jgi:NADPH-dependent curcumin reductase CurA
MLMILDARSYIPPVQIGEVMRGAVLAKVIASKASSLPVGSYVNCTSGWAEVAIVNAKEATLLEIPANGKPTDTMGVLGMTGLTAYFGTIDIGKVKPGDFVVVSGAAGATGSVVCQIAKLKGAKVLGIAGSDDKVQWLKELGCDDALNYKDAEFAKNFKASTKDLIDVFFDNVGGDVLELALSRAKPHSRFVMCGGESPLYLTLVFPALTAYSDQSIQLSRTSWPKGKTSFLCCLTTD